VIVVVVMGVCGGDVGCVWVVVVIACGGGGACV